MSVRSSLCLVLILGLLLAFTSCSGKSECLNGISQFTLDPNGSKCENDCDCNNQRYAGSCRSQVCVSVERAPCSVPNETQPCKTEASDSNPCTEGLRTCGLNLRERYWGDCIPRKPSSEDNAKACGDGLDNDCDGKVDKADDQCATFCNPGARESCYSGKDPKTIGVGICKEGFRLCDSNGSWGPCEGEVPPLAKELCNGKDDNCDGTIDEGLSGCCPTPGKSEPCYSGPAGTAGIGLCQKGTRTCSDKFLWGPCTGEVKPKAEECNKEDDDCDGSVDEGLQDCCTNRGATEKCYTGPAGTENKGPCKAGQRRCSSSGVWSRCDQILPAKETCNGIDDDCDGTVDGQARKCYTAQSGCTKNSDDTYTCTAPCKAGIQTCQNGVWSTCAGLTIPTAEDCNGKDDDCNGKIDDNITTKPPCEKQQGVCKGSTKPPSLCQNGAWQPCSDAEYKAHSTNFAPAIDATCNNLDDDCDGRTDEHAANCVSTLAGGSSAGFQDGTSTSTLFNRPTGIAVGPKGTIYITDAANHRIRKLEHVQNATCGSTQNYTGICVSTLAGDGTSGYVEGNLSTARFSDPEGIAIDAAGNIYIADSQNHSIRKIDTNGVVSTFAGNGTQGNKDGPPSSAQFHTPRGVSIDATGTIYVADTNNHVIRKIEQVTNATCGSQNGYTGLCVTTLAGNNARGFLNGPPQLAQFNTPTSAIPDNKGNIIVADKHNNAIRIIDPKGNVYTLAGDGPNNKGDLDGTANSARFYGPTGLALVPNGDIVVVDSFNHKLRKLSLVQNATCGTTQNYTGTCVSTLAGTGTRGSKNGPASSATFNAPIRLAVDQHGNLLVTDTSNHRIRYIALQTPQSCTNNTTRPCYSPTSGCTQNGSNYTCTTPCKAGTQTCQNGAWSTCKGQSPPATELCNGKDDDCNGQIDDNIALKPPCEKQQGVCKGSTKPSSLCQNGAWQPCSDTEYQTHASLYNPGTDNVCNRTDSNCNGQVDEAAASCVSTFAGEGNFGLTDGPADIAQFRTLRHLAFGPKGSLYATSSNNHVIRKIEQVTNATCGSTQNYTGLCVTTFAGTGQLGSTDGPAQLAQFNDPHGLAFDTNGNLYVADRYRIRKIDTKGIVTTIAGSNRAAFADGAQPAFGQLHGIAINAAGEIIIADHGNHRLRKLAMIQNATCGLQSNYTGWCASTIAGNKNFFTSLDGPANIAQFRSLRDVAIDKNGDIYVADNSSKTIRKLEQVTNATCGSTQNYTGTCVSTIAGTGTYGTTDGPGNQAQFDTPNYLALDSKGNLYVADTNAHSIRKLEQVTNATCGSTQNYTGTCVSTLIKGSSGYLDGPVNTARFRFPHGILFDTSDNLFIIDSGNYYIRRLSAP